MRADGCVMLRSNGLRWCWSVPHKSWIGNTNSDSEKSLPVHCSNPRLIFSASPRLERPPQELDRVGPAADSRGHDGGSSRVLIHRFRRPLVIPPLVICNEPWVRRNAEWHCDPNYSIFCWVLPKAWREHFESRAMGGIDTRVLAKDGATWVLNAMSIQLSRHRDKVGNFSHIWRLAARKQPNE